VALPPERPATALLLPARRRLPGDPPPRLARLLAVAERTACAEGEQAQLARWFAMTPAGWPSAAIQRQAEAGDAGAHAWLRADPVHLRAEMNGARLAACGTLGLDGADADALVACIAPSFDEFGIDIGRTLPAHWYLRLPVGLPPPPATFSPGDALGRDLLALLPGGEAGRAWRRLQTEAQILLSQHPVNASRTARGLPAVNSVWFWGGGALPDAVRATCAGGVVVTAEPELAALGACAGSSVRADDHGGPGLVDLRAARDWDAVAGALLPRVQEAIAAGLVLDFQDGAQLRCRPVRWWHRWRRV
jgi:hypothetical protein